MAWNLRYGRFRVLDSSVMEEMLFVLLLLSRSSARARARARPACASNDEDGARLAGSSLLTSRAAREKLGESSSRAVEQSSSSKASKATLRRLQRDSASIERIELVASRKSNLLPGQVVLHCSL